MKRLQKAAVLTRLIDELRRHKSWAGETHVQKAGYLLQEVTGVPLGYDFVLYHYGPFSFDLRDELTALRADGLVTLEPHLRYGPKLATTPQAEKLQKNFERTLARYSPAIEFVARKLGSSGVYELEKLATALHVTKELGEDASVEDRAKRLTEIKPHIKPQEAREAVRRIDRFRKDACQIAAPEEAVH